MWLNIVIWGEVAEQVSEQVQKGDRIEVKGRLTQRKYEGKYYHDVVADSVEIVQTAKEREAANAKKNGSSVHPADELGELEDHPF
jgi:single-stranded DNA-binding protein